MSDKKLINIPKKLNKIDYQIAENKFIELYSKQHFVKSIYGFGSVTLPGISDLDFVVAVDDDASLPKTMSYEYFDKKTSYILSHNPFIFPKSIFSSINKISNFGSLVYKSKTKYGDLETVDYDQDFSLLILIDYCNYFYPRIFLTFLSEDTLDIRLSIQLLNALSHSISLFRKITSIEYINIFDEFLHNLNEFKQNFFSLSKDKILDNLMILLNEAAITSSELIIVLNKFINQHYWTTISKNNKIIFQRSGYVFTDRYSNSQEIIDRMKELKKIFGGWITILPISLAYPVIKYSNENGCVSNVIKDNLVYESGVPRFIYFTKDILEIIKNRISLINHHYEFYLNPRNEINPVHDYYQMSGLRLSDDKIKLLSKYV